MECQFCYTFVKVSINDLLGRIFSGVSLCTLTAISVDRLLALLLGLRYKQTVTLRRTRHTVVGIWILNISVPFLWRFWSQQITQGVISAIIYTTLLSSALCYTKIYLSLRHQRQDRVHQGQTERRWNSIFVENKTLQKDSVHCTVGAVDISGLLSSIWYNVCRNRSLFPIPSSS